MKKFSSITRVNSHRTSQNRRLVIIAAAAAALFVAVVVIPIVFATVAAMIFAPIASMKTWLFESSASFPQFFRDRMVLIGEVDRLESELAGAGGNRFTIDALSRENDELRRLLGYDGETRILAGIIGRPNALPYDVLMIDRGSDEGVVVGAPVFISDSTIIGIVRQVSAKSSIVELITTPGFETTVFIIGPDIFTHAVGVGGGQLRVGVPQGISIEKGDLVVIPSVTSGVYGEITHIESEPSQPEQYGFVSTHIPISSMRLVSIGSTPVSAVSFEEAQAILVKEREMLLKVAVPEGVLVTAGSSTASTTASSTTELPSGSSSTTTTQ